MRFSLLRAILFGIILWILIFLDSSILMFCFGIFPPDYLYNLIHYILLIIFTLLLASAYFKPEKILKGSKQGFILGLIFVAVLVILDSVITVPFFVNDYNFLIKTEILIGELLVLIICTFVGYGNRYRNGKR